MAVVLMVAAMMTMSGCVDNSASSSTSPNSNNSSGAVGSATGSGSATAQPILAPEPNSYSETITIDVQPTGTIQNTAVPPLQFSFAKSGPDKRASFQLPTVGEVVYLEHAGEKYAEFPGTGTYAQLDDATLGVTLPNLSLMSPSDVIARLREHTDYQNLGPADMDGHQSVKYGFTKAINTNTNAGAITTNTTVFVDQATGLPLRAEIVGNAANGAGARIMLETKNVDLNPQPALFDVPANLRKVSGQQVRDEVRKLAATLSVVIGALQWQINSAAAASATPVPTASPVPSATTPTPPTSH
jgi:hypothetical protein